jgi:hypothetical protein
LIDAALHATATEDSARETTRLTATTGAPAAMPAAATVTTAAVGAAPATPLRKTK